MSCAEITRIELGRRDYSNNIFAKVYVSTREHWRPMLINPDSDINWSHHILGKRIDVPGGVLYPSDEEDDDCDCFTDALFKFDTFNDEVDRIAAEYDTDYIECKAAMYIQAYDCKPHEAARKMGIDDPREVHELASEFEKKNCDTVFVNTASNSVVDAMRFR